MAARKARAVGARTSGGLVADHAARAARGNGNPDKAAAKRAFEAMMTMHKIDIATIEAALRGESIDA